jgi:hypothetical protein
MAETPAELLEPGGRPIGRPGSSDAIRELPGGQAAAEELFERLSKDGIDVTPPGYPGRLVQILSGGYIGYRPKAKSGLPTIDVNIPDTKIRKLKFAGN